MKTPVNVSWPMRFAAVLAAGAVAIAGVDIVDAKGMGGSASRGSFSTHPENHGNGYQSSGHSGKKHEGKKHEGKDHEGDRNATRQGKNGCNTRCQGNKNIIIITNSSGKPLYKIAKPGPGQGIESAKAVRGGIMITIGGHSYTIPGSSVTVKNFTLSAAAAKEAGLSQKIVKNRDGTTTDVLTVLPKQAV
jgi:hypothetical protein